MSTAPDINATPVGHDMDTTDWGAVGGVEDPLPDGDPGFPTHWIPGAHGVAAQLSRMSDEDLLATINAAIASRKRG